MSCKYDPEAGAYLDDHGEECRRDYDGNPTRHCTARRSCSVHLGPDEQTCPRCIARARANLRRIPVLSQMLLPVAVAAGNTANAAADLAAPAAQPRDWTARQIAMRAHLDTWQGLGRITERQYVHAREVMAATDDRHPLTTLGQWDMMIREDYGHPSDERVTIANAADYLDRHLARIANDPEQEFPLLASDLRKCRRHLEEVISLAAKPQRGEVCPLCYDDETRVTAEGKRRPAPRLLREYGHWCDDDDCCKEHYADDSADVWRCPENPAHEWTHAAYEARVVRRKGA